MRHTHCKKITPGAGWTCYERIPQVGAKTPAPLALTAQTTCEPAGDTFECGAYRYLSKSPISRSNLLQNWRR